MSFKKVLRAKSSKPKKRLRKRRKATDLSKAWVRAEKAMSEAIKRRDGGLCVVHKGKCKPGSRFVMEHCVSRAHGMIFFDERNLNWTCQGVNYAKHMGNKHIIRAVEDHVDQKWGEGTVEELRRLSRIPKKHSITELEEIEKTAKEMYLNV